MPAVVTNIEMGFIVVQVFITGSSTGLGLIAGKSLVADGHEVTFHARNQARANDLKREVGHARIVTGDISTVAGARAVADQMNALGRVDAVIHNAGLFNKGPITLTADGIPDVFGINVLAPYILTAKIEGPTRLVYLSSGMHTVSPDLDDLLWRQRRWNGSAAYSESKFWVTALALAVARIHPNIYSNAVDPGWVPTRMGGSAASDNLEQGALTQAALVASKDARLSSLTGQYLYHMAVQDPAPATRDEQVQERLLSLCTDLAGLSI